MASAENEGGLANYVFLCFSKYTICVRARNVGYWQTDFSNTGSAVEILAPGDRVAALASNGKPVFLTGTFMSAPYVVDTLALFYSWEGRLLTPARKMLLKKIADPGFLALPLEGSANLHTKTGYKKAHDGSPYLGALEKKYVQSAKSSWTSTLFSFDPTTTASPPTKAPTPICSVDTALAPAMTGPANCK